jgi:hypothetical protein
MTTPSGVSAADSISLPPGTSSRKDPFGNWLGMSQPKNSNGNNDGVNFGRSNPVKPLFPYAPVNKE